VDHLLPGQQRFAQLMEQLAALKAGAGEGSTEPEPQGENEPTSQ
jgi:hypothetical protein